MRAKECTNWREAMKLLRLLLATPRWSFLCFLPRSLGNGRGGEARVCVLSNMGFLSKPHAVTHLHRAMRRESLPALVTGVCKGDLQLTPPASASIRPSRGMCQLLPPQKPLTALKKQGSGFVVGLSTYLPGRKWWHEIDDAVTSSSRNWLSKCSYQPMGAMPYFIAWPESGNFLLLEVLPCDYSGHVHTGILRYSCWTLSYEGCSAGRTL